MRRWQWLLVGLLLITGCAVSRDADIGGDRAISQGQISPTITSNASVVQVNRPAPPSAEWMSQSATVTPLPPEFGQQANAAQAVLVNLYQRVNPSVVNIEVVSGGNVVASSGSGFVIDQEGHIVTNAHVVIGAREIIVTFADGLMVNADLIGYDTFSDIAVIQVNVPSENLVVVEFGDSTNLQVGQYVVAIGNPFGLRSSMTLGIISATGRTLDSSRLINGGSGDRYSNPAIIQIDATVNPGNSGGPVLDIDGKLIGIATAIRSESGLFEGIAYAVPINTVKRVVPQLIERGYATYPWLGISAEALDAPGVSIYAVAEHLGLPIRNGVLVSSVIENSPAQQAGIRGGNPNNVITIRGVSIRVGGDIIIAINGQLVMDIDDLLEYLVQNTSPGDLISLTVYRDNQTLDVPVMLGERPMN